MATLTSGISATVRDLRITDPGSSRIGANYRIGDEIVGLLGYCAGVYREVDGVYGWVPDETCWYVDRGVSGTEAVSHDAAVAVEEWVATSAGSGLTEEAHDAHDHAGVEGIDRYEFIREDETGTLTRYSQTDDTVAIQAARREGEWNGATAEVSRGSVIFGVVGDGSVSEAGYQLAEFNPGVFMSYASADFHRISDADGMVFIDWLLGTADPTAGDGVAHAGAALYYRDNSGALEVWRTTGAGATAWARLADV